MSKVNGSSSSHWPKVTSENPLGLDDPTLFVTQALIDGKYRDAGSQTFDVIDPATGAILGTCPEMGVKETREAIDAADRVFTTYKNTTAAYRQTTLLKLYMLCEQHALDLARIITWENGKVFSESKGEIAYGNSYMAWNAGEAVRTSGQTIPCALPGARNYTIKQPIGPCALLAPWNFPYAMIARKLAAALAAGCTAVVKPPAETPYSTLALVELIRRAGFPSGVVNCVTTDKNIVAIGQELTTNPLIRKVSFTGSTRVGKLLASNCVGTLKKMSLELGGNAPFIVFDDADIDLAVAGCASNKFKGTGQTCVCANRVYVHEKVYDEFASKLVKTVQAFKLGHGFDADTTHGPLIAGRVADKTQEHIDDAVARGARILCGGKRVDERYYEPTVLADAPVDCLISREETFGPLAALIKFTTEAEVLALSNDSEVGLAGYFYSKNADRIWRLAEALDVGLVGVNVPSVSQFIIPFGGVKQSGYGREGGQEGIGEYLVTKLVTVGQTTAQ